MSFFWQLGREMAAHSEGGSERLAALSADLRRVLPQAEGFPEASLQLIRRFCELYQSAAAADPAVLEELLQVPWGHHGLILTRCRGDAAKGLASVRQVIRHGWSRKELRQFLDADGIKLPVILPDGAPQAAVKLVQAQLQDPYNAAFLTPTWRAQCNARRMKDALQERIVELLTERRAGFAFLGRDYRLPVGEKEISLDLLFYHLEQQCYVVVDVLPDDLEPRDLGRLGTAVVAVDHQLRKAGRDQPTIGLQVCRRCDGRLAQYALEASRQPLGLAEWELSQAGSVDVAGLIPSVEELEAELATMGREEEAVRPIS